MLIIHYGCCTKTAFDLVHGVCPCIPYHVRSTPTIFNLSTAISVRALRVLFSLLHSTLFLRRYQTRLHWLSSDLCHRNAADGCLSTSTGRDRSFGSSGYSLFDPVHHSLSSDLSVSCVNQRRSLFPQLNFVLHVLYWCLVRAMQWSIIGWRTSARYRHRRGYGRQYGVFGTIMSLIHHGNIDSFGGFNCHCHCCR